MILVLNLVCFLCLYWLEEVLFFFLFFLIHLSGHGRQICQHQFEYLITPLNLMTSCSKMVLLNDKCSHTVNVILKKQDRQTKFDHLVVCLNRFTNQFCMAYVIPHYCSSFCSSIEFETSMQWWYFIPILWLTICMGFV